MAFKPNKYINNYLLNCYSKIYKIHETYSHLRNKLPILDNNILTLCLYYADFRFVFSFIDW